MVSPAEYGRRLIPQIVDERARSDPDRAVYSVPISNNDLSQGFRNVTARVFANAINRVAWWLDEELGKGSSCQTIGYIGPHDLRYAVLLVACVKAGYTLLLISPRNSTEASLSVLAATDCNFWVLPRQQPKFLPNLIAQRPMKTLNIAEVDEVLQDEPVLEYPYTKTFHEASQEPFCVLHTSGSTGHPKPIVWKNSLLGTCDATRLLPESHGRPPWVSIFEERDRFYSAFAFYHAAGLMMNVLMNSFYGTCNLLGPAQGVPSLELIDSLLDHGSVQIWSIIPSLVDDIGENPGVHTKFRNSKAIIASGGPVNYASANKATEIVRIINITGTSEGLFMGSTLPEPEDWIYFSFHPYANFDFREIEPGIFEHYAVRKDEYVAQFQGLFHTFPDVEETSLKDLYTQHPRKPDLWLYKGRTDDTVVLSSGEKILPTDMEAIVSTHPAVSACLVAGTGNFQASLLVELLDPKPKTLEVQKAILDSIYETVKRANTQASFHARITKEFIMFAKPEKPFARTDKNTIKRRMTLLLYEEEIKDFYVQMRSNDITGFDTEIDASSLETTARGIRQVSTVDLTSSEAIGFDDDLFHAGLNSLLAVRVAKCLRSAAEKYEVDEEKKAALNPQLIYAHPTINKLSAVFFGIIHDTHNSSDDLVESQLRTMKDYRAKYAANLPNNSGKWREHRPKDGNTIILTGSTGSLGSYVLESLAQHSSIKRIYCLNRSGEGMKKQAEVSQPRGLMTAWSTHKVRFLKADLSKPSFGLNSLQYQKLLQQTTHVIHNQWPVNFKYEIASFEPHIQGVRGLIDFCLNSERASSLFFVSTMGTVTHLQTANAIAETPIKTLKNLHDGYGSSKQVCELILQDAAEKSGLNATICRVGQIGGPVLRGTQGMWGKQEWFPTVIAGSKHLGLLPSSLGSMNRVDWIPVDILADIIVELSGAAELHSPFVNGAHELHVDDRPPSLVNGVDAVPSELTHKLSLYHAINPNQANWADILPCVHRYLGLDIKIVSWTDWVSALSRSQTQINNDLTRQNPGLQLLDFFTTVSKNAKTGHMLPALATERSRARSKTLAALQPVGEEWMDLWLRQWGF